MIETDSRKIALSQSLQNKGIHPCPEQYAVLYIFVQVLIYNPNHPSRTTSVRESIKVDISQVSDRVAVKWPGTVRVSALTAGCPGPYPTYIIVWCPVLKNGISLFKSVVAFALFPNGR